MAKNSKPKSTKKRVKVKDLPAAERELSAEEAKRVKGGVLIGLLLPLKEQKPASSKQFTNTTFDDDATRIK